MSRTLLIARCLGLGLLTLAACTPSTPTPTITLSATPTTIEDGQTITLKAEVKGTTIKQVEFYRVLGSGESQKLGQDSTAPYEFSIPLLVEQEGEVGFSAKAVSSDNQVANSETVKVLVKTDQEAPKIALNASKNTLSAAATLNLTANATDNKGVVKVEFYRGNDKLGEDTTPADGFSHSLAVSASDNGLLKYKAKAYDKKGNVGTSAEVGVIVDIDVTPPNISLSASKTTVSTAGPILLTANTSDNKSIAKVEFFKGSIKLSEKTGAPFTLEQNFGPADNGTHTYTAKAFDPSGNSSTSAMLNVVVDIDEDSPTVSLSADQSSLGVPGSISLSAAASDNNSITKVEFYKGDTKLGEDTLAPYTFEANYPGDYFATDSFSAKAFDNHGNSATSNTVQVAIDIDQTNPTVSLSATSSSITTPGPITLSANAGDNRGVSKVEFWEGTTKLGEDTDAPFAFEINYTAADNGNHIYSAKALDAKGNSATSGPISVNVNIDVANPTVSLSADKTSLKAPDSILLTANASDDIGVTKVEFYRNGSKLGEDTTAPYEWPFTYPNLSYITTDSFSARAYDAQDNVGTSNTVKVVLDIDIDPPVWTSFSASNTNVVAAGSIALNAFVSDNKAISRVEFLEVIGLTENLIATDFDASNGYTHSLNFGGSDNGIHKYKARAWDGGNNYMHSEEVWVTVNIAPSISSFSANNPVLPASGGTVGLSWVASDADNYSLSVDPSAGVTGMPTGSISTANHSGIGLPANPSASPVEYTFTLTANPYGSAASASQTLKVTVAPTTGSQITSFEVDTSSLSSNGGSINLSWAAANVSNYNLSVSPAAGVTGMPSNPLSPGTTSATITLPTNPSNTDQTYTFTLTANPATGTSDSKNLSVVVARDLAAPTIQFFTPNRATVGNNQTLTLTTKASDNIAVTKVEIYRGGTYVADAIYNAGSANWVWSIPGNSLPNATYIFTAKVYDAAGNVTTSTGLSIRFN